MNIKKIPLVALATFASLTSPFIPQVFADDIGVSAKVYGYIKLDASYDTAQSNPGDYYRIATSNSQNVSNSQQYNMTANQSRFGVMLSGPDAGGAKTTGRFEFDFYNDNAYSTTAWDNKPIPQLRLAYLNLKWEESDFELRAGQDWDVISPLLTSTLNYYAGWNAGDLGYRRPQIRITKGIKTGEDSKFITQFAIAKNVGSDAQNPLNANLNDGNDSTMPQFQARIAYQAKLWTDTPMVLGVSGHYGVEKYYLTTDLSSSSRVTTWSANGDLTLPITSKITLTGEFTRGQDLRQFAGGIGIGALAINGTGVGIHATDFWAQVNYKFITDWQLTLGGGQSKLDGTDLAGGALTNAKRNSFVFGNVIYNISAPVSVGLEVTRLATDYVAVADGRDTRFQTSLQYSF